MLNYWDKRLIARDPALPGLAALLDGGLLLERLRRFAEFADAVRVDVQYLRYKPQNSCAGTLKITLNNGEVKFYAAKALTAERFEQSWNHPKRQMLVKERSPFAPFGLRDLGILLIHPVYDRGIGGLHWLADEKAREKLLGQSALPGIRGDEVKIDILRYKPERRLVARVSNKEGKALAVVRACNPRDFPRILTGAAFGAAQDHVTLLAADADTRTVITGWQKGHSLDVEEQGALPSRSTTELIVKKLSRLHKAPYRYPVVYTIDDEIRAMRGVLNNFEYIFPEQRSWFERLMYRIEQGLRLQPEKQAVIHGDFSLDQVIRSQNKQGISEIRLLDWDRAAQGHPLMDPATMQARLELQVIYGVIGNREVENFLTQFLESYQKNSGYELTGLPYFVASALLRLATEPFRKRMPNMPALTLQLLQRVEMLLENAEKPTALYAARLITDDNFPDDPMLKSLTSAQRMDKVLTEILPEGWQGHVECADLIRYKPKRRALIDYAIRTAHGAVSVIAKYRAKGLDKRAYAVQKTLRNAGFDEQSQISVPAVLGRCEELNCWFQGRENGVTVGRLLLPDNRRLAFLGERVARAINALHQSAVAFELDLPGWTTENEMDILRRRLTEVHLIRPQLQTRIADLLTQCEKLAKDLGDTSEVSLHRDFYQDQILEKNGKPGEMILLDLDLLCRGPAALDAGNYIAHIMEYALRRYGDTHALDEHKNAFAYHFARQSKTATAAQIEDYVTLSLARHIYLSTQFSDRLHTTEELLRICEDRLRVQNV